MNKAILIGSPNSGKSLLFNRLTGLNQKVANFPGITVDISSGTFSQLPELELVDYPGAYSLRAISGEEQIAVENFRKALDEENTRVILCVLDATRLEKSLHLILDVINESRQKNKKVIVLANMIDVLAKHNMSLDCKSLAQHLQVPVIPISAKTGLGMTEFYQQLNATLQSDAQSNGTFSPLSAQAIKALAAELTKNYGPKGDVLVKSQAKLDAFFLHSWIGGIAFFLIMYVLFQSIFTWAAPMMDAIESTLALMADFVIPMIPHQGLQDFVSGALFGGIGAFLVFVPQIFVLTVIVGILEDSGYMSRAALICHRPLRMFGLTGKSFIPMLSGVACAIPGIYAARNIDSPRKRFLTYLAIPLMPCSARLPVYTLLIAAFIPAQNVLGGLIGLQGLAMFLVYLFGLLCGLLVTAAVSKSRPELNQDLPFILEMPPYRIPSWIPLLRNAWNRSKHFVTKAGSVIFTVTVIVWLLGYFPNHGADLGSSWLGYMGKAIEPLFAPLGLDWRYGVAILSSFLAREVFVGTLGTLFGIEGADEEFMPLAEHIQASGLPIGSGFALLVFFAIALQCVSTLAILQKESGSSKLPVQMFFAYFILAYLLSFMTFHLVEWLV
jgi:ferrous iron transport protein B